MKHNYSIAKGSKLFLSWLVFIIALVWLDVGLAQTEATESEPQPETSISHDDQNNDTAPIEPEITDSIDATLVEDDQFQPDIFDLFESPEEEEELLSIYGYADFTYRKYLLEKDNKWNAFFSPHGTFAVGHLNLYFDGNISPSWRSMLEVRMLYLPNGSEEIGPTGDVTIVSTKTPDSEEIDDPYTGRGLKWGGIEIERAWVEHIVNDKLKIRAGQWLTPFGIWNVDHGSPIIISLARPYIIGLPLFPERQTGVQLHGSFYAGQFTFGYHLSVSNGRGSVPEYRDMDDKLAYGGRLYMETNWIGDLSMGVSWYFGRETFVDKTLIASIEGENLQLDAETSITDQDDELSLAADIQWKWEKLTLATEIVYNEWSYTKEGRPFWSEFSSLTLARDDRRWGIYSLIAYQLPWFNISPYVLVEYFSFATNAIAPSIQVFRAGINSKLDPSVVIKLEYFLAHFKDGVAGTPFANDMSVVATQIAWVF